MTLQTLVIFILSFIATVLVAGLILAVFLIGRSTVKNNFKKAYIYILNGLVDVEPKKAKLVRTTKKGDVYKYGNKRQVFVPKSYKVRYIHNRRMIGLGNPADMVAAPLFGETPVQEIDDLVYDLVESNIGGEGIRALKGKQAANIIMVAIVAFIVGAILVFGGTQIAARQQAKQPAAIEQPTKSAPIEVR